MKLYVSGVRIRVFVDANMNYKCIEGSKMDVRFLYLYKVLNDLGLRGSV